MYVQQLESYSWAVKLALATKAMTQGQYVYIHIHTYMRAVYSLPGRAQFAVPLFGRGSICSTPKGVLRKILDLALCDGCTFQFELCNSELRSCSVRLDLGWAFGRLSVVEIMTAKISNAFPGHHAT